MGIHFFRNAAAGGAWIIQKSLKNSPWLAGLLPPAPPLSTMRVITASYVPVRAPDDDDPPRAPASASAKRDIAVMTAVLRLGRAGAATDHSAVFFDVDVPTVRGSVSGLGRDHFLILAAFAAVFFLGHYQRWLRQLALVQARRVGSQRGLAASAQVFPPPRLSGAGGDGAGCPSQRYGRGLAHRHRVGPVF
jgi:hypothetical protein